MARYSATLMEHFGDPRNRGTLTEADYIGSAGQSGSGGVISIFLRTQCEQIVEARFEAAGCGVTIAAGSALTEILTGRSLLDCKAITVEELIAALGGVPADKIHCPALAVAALQAALQDRHGKPCDTCKPLVR